MVSSLAAQLTQNASLNASLLVDRSRRKPTESYLFTGKDADQYDLESIHALGVNGFIQLTSLDPRLSSHETALFSNTAKSTDRTLLTAEANSQLDASINSFLQAVGPYLLDAPTGKVIEWLVRRFRVHEFNVEALISVFLPYHETPHFAKINTILHIKPNTTWSFLLPFKSAAQSVPRIALVAEMKKNTAVARQVASFLPNSIKEGYSHRTLVAFNAATLHDFISQSKSLDEGSLAYLLPALIEPLHVGSSRDTILGSYVLIAALSQKCSLTPDALKALLVAMISCAHKVSVTQATNALIAACEAQEVLDDLPSSSVKAFLRIKGINEEIRQAMNWEGSEKLVLPLLSGLTRRLKDDAAVEFAEILITSTTLPSIVTRRLTRNLLERAASGDGTSDNDVLNALLDNILQRHPAMYREVVDEMGQEGDDGVKNRVEQITIALTMGYASSKTGKKTGNVDAIVASSNADDKIRANAVQTLLEKCESSDTDTDAESLYASLLARIQDKSQSVLEVLYSSTESLLRIVTKNPKIYLDSLDATLASSSAKPKRTILKLHLTFLMDHFLPKVDDNDLLVKDALNRLIFPFLLSSKPRQHTADLVWDILDRYLNRSKGSSAVKELLKGCDEARKVADEEDSTERMAKVNHALAARIAENILSSNNYPEHLNTLIAKLTDENPHARVLGYLIAKGLVARLSGEHQVAAAQQVLDSLSLEQLATLEERKDDISEDLDNVERNLVLKPSSKSTSSWIQASVLDVISGISPLESLPVDYISSSLQRNPDERGFHYAELVRKVYKISNSLAPSLRRHILCKLFASLKGDAMLFFAGIFASDCYSSEQDGVVKFQLKESALHHASAFVEAADDSEEKGIDFQTVLPCLLVALQNQSAEVRRAATVLLTRVKKTTERKFGSVYAFDVVYGNSESEIQYLSQEESKKYLSSLSNHIEHILHDPHYVRVFHKDHLVRSASDTKKETSYKHHILCYLFSHIGAATEASVQCALLDVVQDISDKAKVEMLLPTIQQIASIMGSPSNPYGPYLDGIARSIAGAFDASVATELNEKVSLWDTFLAVINASLRSTSSSMRLVIAERLKKNLFSRLQRERRVDLCVKLIEQGSEDSSSVQAYVKNLLSSILNEAPVIVQLLDSLRAEIVDGPRSTKRPKLSESNEPPDVLLRLGLFAEVLGTISLPGSLDLISHLLETLSRVMQFGSPARSDVIFIEQSLMAAIDSAAEKVQEIPNLAPNAIRLDILVELIRVTENPQTFHQALLLIANLARLAPDSVLHNIMPVFTFMGSNVFHRDDAYSFATIDSIVPVMVSSLKKDHDTHLDLYIASRDFLRVFTDAANHIPRHRRTNFFAHLVDVLGPADFLAPVCLLLVDKSSNRIARQSSDDAQATLAVPTSLMHHYSPALQIAALVETLREAERLAKRATGTSTDQPTLLDDLLSEESSLSPTILCKRRAQAIITFVGHSAKSFASSEDIEGSDLSKLVSLLISLATAKSGSTPESKIEDLNKSARLAMDRVLSLVPARDFIDAILSMLGSGDVPVKAGALDLLYLRLPRISNTVRQSVVPSIVKIAENIQKLLSQQPEKSIIVHAFKAVESVGSTMAPGEESCLTNLVSFLVSASKDRDLGVSAMSALATLPPKLGPRLIPFFREIVSQAVAVLREAEKDLAVATVKVLHGLLLSIPSFWSSVELGLVLKLSLDPEVSLHLRDDTVALVKAITKRAPSKTLLPTVCELWPSIERSNQSTSINGYFDILKRSIRSAGRPEVQDHLRGLFSVFLAAFDTVKDVTLETESAKSRAISAFVELVVKLNEATFRPLFRRLHDWALVEGNNTARTITFCQVYNGLLDYFKNLMNPYMALLLNPLVDILKVFLDSTSNSKELLTTVLETFAKSISYDDGGFWRDEKIRQVSPSLISLISVCAQLNVTEAKTFLQDALTSVAEHVVDDTLLKTINLDILMHTRSEDVTTRIFALSCSEALWKMHGGKLLGFVAETATFIAECCEDEHDTVAKESFKLKDAVESVAGSINGI
ncbi:snoRNA-binding rRNA-processing protein utp10 [Marasmius crinis-equi]|uniref:U3 small nucleolar RNA-associated protein 10 n=1 Tax=Marasmius crinis-equi TaxID=585013 RepID=A0ABR3FII6_9AGAR